MTINGGLCTLGDCNYTVDSPSNFRDSFFKVDRFFTTGVFDYEIIDANLDVPLTLKIINSDGDFLVYYFNTLSSSQKEKGNIISIYPNPVTGNIYLNSKVNLIHSSCDILDITGKIIIHGDFLIRNFINTSKLNNGIYFLSVTNSQTGSLTIKKIVKN